MVEGSNAKLDSAWILHVDGVSNSYESRANLILINFEVTVTEYALQFNFKALNNQTEYEVLLVGLKIAKKLGINNLKVFTDSQLITRQVKGEYEARDPTIAKYLQKVKDLTSIFGYFEIFYISKEKNARADALSQLAMTSSNLLSQTFIEYLEQSSIDKVEEVL